MKKGEIIEASKPLPNLENCANHGPNQRHRMHKLVQRQTLLEIFAETQMAHKVLSGALLTLRRK